MVKRFPTNPLQRPLSGLALLLCMISPSLAAEIPIRSVALFKNGLGFFMREGTVEPVNDYVHIEHPPSPTHGTLWFTAYDPGVAIEEVVALRRDGHKAAEVLADLIRANIGAKVKVRTSQEVYEGKIASLLPERPSEPSAGGATVVIETASGSVALPVHEVLSAEFAQSPATMVSVKGQERVLRLQLKSSKPKSRIGLAYLQKGVLWAPSYLVDISNDQKAKLLMSSVVFNEAEDLHEADLYFVVGYPQFVYQNVPSPMVQDQSLAAFLSSLIYPSAPGAVGAAGNVATQQIRRYEADPGYGSYDVSGDPLPGEQLEDLFFYEKKGVTLKKGERGYYPVFSADVDYRNVYEWTVQTTSQSQRNEEVWHKLRLKNATPYPWTTAPAMIMKNGRALAQNTLDYTPKGGEVTLPITLATDIQARADETEIKRDREAKRFNNTHYDLVTVKGDLTLKNFKKTKADMEVIKHVTGEVQDAGGGQVTKKGWLLQAVNPSSLLKWTFTLKAGEEKTLHYVYSVYVRP